VSHTTGTLRRTATGFFAQFSLGAGARKGALLVGVGLDENGSVHTTSAGRS
jgi:hypothetical protein